MLIHTHTHNTDYPTLLLRDIQVTNTKRTPFKYRINAKAKQSLRKTYAELTQSYYRTKTLGIFNRPK